MTSTICNGTRACLIKTRENLREFGFETCRHVNFLDVAWKRSTELINSFAESHWTNAPNKPYKYSFNFHSRPEQYREKKETRETIFSSEEMLDRTFSYTPSISIPPAWFQAIARVQLDSFDPP
jgi:hypothetical protein